MRLTPITEPDYIEDAFNLFSEQIEEGELFERPLNFIGGDSGSEIYWHQQHRFWATLESYENRYLCACGTENPNETFSLLRIICALNPPFEGYDRRYASLFLRDEYQNIYLAHNGSFPRLSKQVTERNFVNWQTVSWPDNKITTHIVICQVNSTDMLSDLSTFIHRVQELKNGRQEDRLTKPKLLNRKMREAKEGYVYLLKCDKAYKIGVSIDVEVRVKQISPLMPYPVEIIHVIRSKDCYGLESKLHKKFQDRRLRGEWFALFQRDIKYIMAVNDI